MVRGERHSVATGVPGWSVPEAGDDPDEDESEDHADGSMVLGSSWRSEPFARWVRG